MARTTERKAALRHARELLRRHILIDGHNDLPWTIRNAGEETPAAEETARSVDSRGARGVDGRAPRDELAAYELVHERRHTGPERGHTDFPRARRGGLGGQFWSVYVPGTGGASAHHARMQLEQIDLAHRLIQRYPRQLRFAWSARDVREAFAAGRIASLLGMEGGHVIEDSLGALRAFARLGARSMTLTHGVTHGWADSATDEPRHGGLSPFGKEVVREMNRLGMLVDLSHVAPTTMRDALDVTEAPVIFSHSSTRALCDVPRNVPDEILRRVPANGGVVMITFVAGFVSPDAAAITVPALAEVQRRQAEVTDPALRATIEHEVMDGLEVPPPPIGLVADHVEHVVKGAGVEHVGIGGDFDGTAFTCQGLEDVSGYPNLFAELIERGWTDGDLARLAGENVLRVMREAEAVAGRLRRRV